MVVLTACGRQDDLAAASTSTAVPPYLSMAASPTDRWIGKWFGPEGTFLEIFGGGGKYRITISNLDGPRSFEGVSNDGQIVFERDGVHESIRAGSGAETGMKWLAERSDCLVVNPGEGYCRG